jgi:hypothetical protein
MESAARDGNLEEVKRRHAAGESLGVAAYWAAINGRLETLQWIRANGGGWTHCAADGAASNGHLETLQWIRANSGEWTSDASDWADMWGHLETLEWLTRSNAPLHVPNIHLRDNAERERHVAEEALDHHLIPDLARVAGNYLCLE